MNMKINSKFKLGTAKARRMLPVIALVLFPFLASERASAQNATATLFSGGLPSITITTTGTFTLDLNIVTTFQCVGITYFLQMLDTAGLGQFEISVWNNDGSAFSDGLPPVVGNPHGILDPVNDFDLGAVILDPNNPLPAGSYFVATLTLIPTSGAYTPGVYHIHLDSRGIVADNQFNGHAITSNTFTITVVPEPATVGLAVLGGVMLLAFVWRARRVSA
jgi:hypothetical protein